MFDVRTSRILGRLGLAAGAVLLTATTVAGPAAAASDQRAGVFKVRFAGYVSEAAWSTCPDLEAEELGTVCTYTDVLVSSSMTSEQAGSEIHVRDPRTGTVKIFESTCVVAEFEPDPGVVERTCLPRVERFGSLLEGADVLTDPQLVSTQATASVPVKITDFVNDSEDTGTVDVVAEFQGTGATRRIDERSHVSGRDVMFREGTRGWVRDCTAAASFDGVPVPGELTACQMYRVRQSQMSVYPNRAGPPARS